MYSRTGQRKNFFPPLEFEPQSFLPATSPCTDYAVSASVTYSVPRNFLNNSYRYIFETFTETKFNKILGLAAISAG
jgi:hypothetical protein